MQCTAAAARVQAGGSASPYLSGTSLRAAVPRAQQHQTRASRQSVSCTMAPEAAPLAKSNRPDKTGRFGAYGGKYVPETLIVALQKLEEAYEAARNDPAFQVSPARRPRMLAHFATRSLSRRPPLRAGRA